MTVRVSTWGHVVTTSSKGNFMLAALKRRKKSVALIGLFSILGMSLAGCDGYADGHATDGVNTLQVAASCSFQGISISPFACTGGGSGFLGGQRFVGRTVTNACVSTFNDLITCGLGDLGNCRIANTPSGLCKGGTLDATGTGTWGTQRVGFHFVGIDRVPDPTSYDTMSITLYTLNPNGSFGTVLFSESFNCINCFNLVQTNHSTGS